MKWVTRSIDDIEWRRRERDNRELGQFRIERKGRRVILKQCRMMEEGRGRKYGHVVVWGCPSKTCGR